MLMRGCVEYDFGSVCGKFSIKTLFIPYRADFNRKIQLFPVFADKLLLNIVGIVLVYVKNNKLYGGTYCYLSAKLASDRASAARYKYYLSVIVALRF